MAAYEQALLIDREGRTRVYEVAFGTAAIRLMDPAQAPTVFAAFNMIHTIATPSLRHARTYHRVSPLLEQYPIYAEEPGIHF